MVLLVRLVVMMIQTVLAHVMVLENAQKKMVEIVDQLVQSQSVASAPNLVHGTRTAANLTQVVLVTIRKSAKVAVNHVVLCANMQDVQRMNHVVVSGIVQPVGIATVTIQSWKLNVLVGPVVRVPLVVTNHASKK
jgi:hypothetical protein